MKRTYLLSTCLLLASSLVHALPNSVTLRVSDTKTQVVDLEKLITRRVNQSSTIEGTCQRYCDSHNSVFDIEMSGCTPGSYRVVRCSQTIDTSYDVPDHTVTATVEVTAVASEGLAIDQDVRVSLGAGSVSVSSSDKNIGFVVNIETVRNPPRRGEPDFVHKVSLRPIDLVKLNDSAKPRDVRLGKGIMTFQTGPQSELSFKESVSISRFTLFTTYSWSSYSLKDFAFKSEPYAGGLLHTVDLAKFGARMKQGKKYDISLTRSATGTVPEITNFSSYFNESYTVVPKEGF